jgi:hypothetical protein
VSAGGAELLVERCVGKTQIAKQPSTNNRSGLAQCSNRGRAGSTRVILARAACERKFSHGSLSLRSSSDGDQQRARGQQSYTIHLSSCFWFYQCLAP